MPGLTQTRVRLTLSQKVKIIEESKKSDFSRKKICEEYSISKATISSILKDQKTGKHIYQKNHRRISIQTSRYYRLMRKKPDSTMNLTIL